MSQAVLVTGATGFIGAHLIAALRERKYTTYTHSFSDGDISDCTLNYSGVQHVFHLAGKSFVPDSWATPKEFYDTNVAGTVNVLEFCRRQGASLTYVSSYVYGQPQRLPISEEHPVVASNPYSHTKLIAESVCSFYAEKFGLEVCTVRPFNIYGPGQNPRFLIPTLVAASLCRDGDVIEVADDRPRRDFLHVSDFILFLLATIDHQRSGVYNAGSGESVSIQDIVNVINDFAPRRKRLVSRGETRPQEIMDVIADIRKAGRELDWIPRVPLREGIGALVKSMVLCADAHFAASKQQRNP